MKYLFRILGVFLIWPLMLLFYFIGWVIINILLIIYHFNFKHCYGIKKENLFFYLESHGSESKISKDLTKVKWISYQKYYSNPLNMLTNKVTKIYNDNN